MTPADALAEIKRLYYAATRVTIVDGEKKGIDLDTKEVR